MREIIRIGIVGATGAVGQALIGLLQADPFPGMVLRLFASPRSAGRVCQLSGLTYEDTTLETLQRLDVAFLAIDASLSQSLAPALAKAGTLVIDKSAAFRMVPGTPLVVPEINGHTLSKNTRLVASPNCSAIIACMVLAPLHNTFGLNDVTLSTYQAASGAGALGLQELEGQLQSWAKGEGSLAPVAFPHPLAFNVIPEIGGFGPSGETGEEVKLREESQKILSLPALALSATCVRVPTLRSHAIAITASFESAVNLEAARCALAHFPGLSLVDDPTAHLYPTPLGASNRHTCLVGRLRTVPGYHNRLSLFVAGDQLLKGASLNALQILKIYHENGWI